MAEVLQSTKDPALDAEIESLWAVIRALEARIVALEAR